MIQIKKSRSAAANATGMAFDPRQLWQLSILEVAGIATLALSVVVIAGLLYSIW